MKKHCKMIGEGLIIILSALCPVSSVVNDAFRCHPMAALLRSNNFNELFWATISGEYVSESFCKIPIPDNLTETKMNLKTSEFELNLILELPHSIFHTNTKVVVTDENGDYEPNVHFSPRCFLSGHPEDEHGIASISYCQGWRGIITTNGTDYLFEPPHSNCGHGFTLVGKRTSDLLMEQVKKQNNAKHKNYPEFKMEVGIFYDQQMNDFLEKELRAITLEQKLNFLVTQWNVVQYEFNKKIMLESRIQIIIKYIHFFKKDPNWYRIGDDLEKSMDDICNWASRNDLKLDHLHVGTGWKTGNLLGVGGSGGVCNSGRCAISKTRQWGYINSICHEIAHGIDIPHDDHPNCDDTPGISGLMGERGTGWSKCSVKYFKLWLERGRGKCLLNKDVHLMQKPKGKPSFNIDTYGSGLFPAMYHDRDQYCEEKFGKGFRYVALYPQQTCGIQSCANLDPGPEFGAIRVDEEGIDGLYCGPGKVCRLDLRCENLTQANLWEPVPVQIGNWGAWSPYSECSRTCGVGYSYSRRNCDNPRPINAEWCNGNQVRIKVCNQQPCKNNNTNLATHLRERASETCAMLVNNKFIDGNKFLKTGSPYSNISRSLKYFQHYPHRSINGYDNLGRLHYVSPDDCATACFKHPNCRSFEYKKSLMICDLSKETTLSHSLVNNKYWDLYELPADETRFFQRSHFQIIDDYDNLTRFENVSVLSCASVCLRDHLCRSFEYNRHMRICRTRSATSHKYNTRRNISWDLYEITDDVSGKEGLCEVRCDPIRETDEGTLGHVGFMPDGSSCGSTIDSNWRCLFGKCQKLQTRKYTEFP